MAKRYSLMAGKVIDVPDPAPVQASTDTSLADLLREVATLKAALDAMTSERAQLMQRAQTAEQSLQAATAAHAAQRSAPASVGPITVPAPVVNVSPTVSVQRQTTTDVVDIRYDGMGRVISMRFVDQAPLTI